MFKHLKIKENRYIDTIHETAKWGAKGVWGPGETETGVCRLALSDEDKKVRDWFVEEVKSLGCKVTIDAMGNIFAVYPGKNEGLPLAIGSHLDTQPTGGRYDGILGVLGGLEVIRTMKDNDFVPNYPIAVIDWTNEEGARFPKSLMSSSVWAEVIDKEEVYNLKSITDKKPVTVLEELERIGYKGETEVSYKANPIKAHFEIHIEQGPILEENEKKIGVVNGVQAYSWTNVRVKGLAVHTGSTPFKSRSDALLAASAMIVKGNEIAKKHSGLFSVGSIECLPNVANVVPEEVVFIADVRSTADESLYAIKKEYEAEFTKIAGDLGKNTTVVFEELITFENTRFDKKCIECVRSSASELFGEDKIMDIISGPGHDSCATATKVPTTMIFIPSKNGISHNPAEYSSPEQCHEGFQVLLNSVLKYDSLRTD
ncbi:hypothetical protein CLIB1444_22S00716 [[Candida] jaroonii]|uniref:Uncharacterized protein n=1 Tax=[Candida] jaroonii TaxID=467808 RepID=A0ACA9YFR8_9ASCO|nr:hypothetical protein CLIB1444_22S00716 [[Candida] jaroonii]